MSSAQETQAHFHYWTQPKPVAFSEIFDVINGTHQNLKTCVKNVHDIRMSSVPFDHSIHGFQMAHHEIPTSTKDLDFLDSSTVVTEYWPGLLSMVKTQLNARSVTAMNSIVRQSTKEAHSQADVSSKLRAATAKEAHKASKPFHIVHNDYSADGARNALRAILPSFFKELGLTRVMNADEQHDFFELRRQIVDAEDRAVASTNSEDYSKWDGTQYQGPRWAVFSVWQPLEVVRGDPLAMIDATSLCRVPPTFSEKHQTYTSFQIPHNDRPGFANHMGNNIMPLPPKENQQHRWYWISEQRPDEVILLKLFDSEAWLQGSKVAPCSPHSAFLLPDQNPSNPRVSIETRVFVIW